MMAHPAQQAFCEKVKELLPEFFRWRHVLDIGSLDINGSNKSLFKNCSYVGIDVGPGKNVDIVCPAHQLEFTDQSFDVIVSTECFEHDQFYEKSLQKAAALLAQGGLFFFSCAGFSRAEHGTRRCHPENSPLTMAPEHGEWSDYYKNLTEHDVRAAIDIEGLFGTYEFSESQSRDDLYFWGVKK